MPRRLELDEPFLSASKLPANVGCGKTVVLRTTRSTTLYDHVGQLRSEVDDLRARFRLNDPRRVPRSQLELGLQKGELTGSNPLDRFALLRVAVELQDGGILAMPRAVELYARTRAELQTALRTSDVGAVALYPGLEGVTVNTASSTYAEAIERRLLRALPVARVPNRAFHDSNILGNPGQKRWHNALIPDATSVDDPSFLASLKCFYQAVAEKEKLDARGSPLSADDFANLQACVGGQVGELLEFLVCKGFDDATRRNMGITDTRARQSVARYDAVCSQLPALRRAAEHDVASKELFTTGATVVNEAAAVRRRMKKLSDAYGLFLNESQAQIAKAQASVREDPEVLRALQAIVRNMGASFKSEDGMTPADKAVLPQNVDALWGTVGSQCERIHTVLQGFLEATGRTCSLAETKRLLHKANISCSKYVPKHDPVSIAQHFAARQKKTVRQIEVLFSAHAFSEGLDYKSLFSVNSDKNNRGRGEMMIKSEKRQTFSHGAGGDSLGKLALFSTLLRPVHTADLVTLFQGDISPDNVPGWKKECFRQHPGLAVAFGHVRTLRQPLYARAATLPPLPSPPSPPHCRYDGSSSLPSPDHVRLSPIRFMAQRARP